MEFDEDKSEAKTGSANSRLSKVPCGSSEDGQHELYCGHLHTHASEHYEEFSYDPRLLAKEIAWLDQSRTLGLNFDTQKAFVSGLGSYLDCGNFEICEAGTDPNDPQPESDRSYPCYSSYGGDVVEPTFPFHEACFAILVRRLGYTGAVEIDKDALYEVVRSLSEDDRRSLLVDYGGEFSKQFWESTPGKEYVVTCPLPEDGGLKLGETLWKCLPKRLLLRSPLTDLSRKVRQDPLHVLSFDVLHLVLRYLPIPDSLNFIQASHHVCTTTRESMFWRSMIRTYLAQWFWEIRGLVYGEEIVELDYKGLFLWLEKISQPGFGIKGPFMGVANRRRIWVVCAQMVGAYDAEFTKRGIVRA